jgi:hypothetical protein
MQPLRSGNRLSEKCSHERPRIPTAEARASNPMPDAVRPFRASGVASRVFTLCRARRPLHTSGQLAQIGSKCHPWPKTATDTRVLRKHRADYRYNLFISKPLKVQCLLAIESARYDQILRVTNAACNVLRRPVTASRQAADFRSDGFLTTHRCDVITGCRVRRAAASPRTMIRIIEPYGMRAHEASSIIEEE